MRMNYIAKIQSSLKGIRQLPAKHKTSQLLDGSYHSIYKGRSLNFDELREYVVGDDCKDIDWKASARSQKLLVKQYLAEKKHNLLLVMDSNARMLADTSGGMEKRELGILGAGSIAYLVNQNGDFVSALYATPHSLQRFPFRTGVRNIEHFLEDYHKQITLENHSNLQDTLDYLLHNYSRHMILLLLTDLRGIESIPERTLQQLLLQNDILVLCMEDADVSGSTVYSVERQQYPPAFFTENKKLVQKQQNIQKSLEASCKEKLKHFGIPMAMLSTLDEIPSRLIELLQSHKK